MWICKGHRIDPKLFLEKKVKLGGLSLPEFKNYYKAIEIKTMWVWCKDRHRKKQNGFQN